MLHELKTWPYYFEAVLAGVKRFELRRADRDFQSGDTLRLKEWHPESKRYSGREVDALVTFVLDVEEGGDFGLMAGFCAMSIKLESGEGADKNAGTDAGVVEPSL